MPESMKCEVMVRSRVEDPEVQRERAEITKTRTVSQLSQITFLKMSWFREGCKLQTNVDPLFRDPFDDFELQFGLFWQSSETYLARLCLLTLRIVNNNTHSRFPSRYVQDISAVLFVVVVTDAVHIFQCVLNGIRMSLF